MQLLPRVGFEPTTCWSQVQRSTCCATHTVPQVSFHKLGGTLNGFQLPITAFYKCVKTYSFDQLSVNRFTNLYYPRWGVIAAGVGRAFSCICMSVSLFVSALKGKRLELSAPNLVHIYSIAVARHALTQSQGRTVTKSSQWRVQLRPCAAAASVGLHVDTTAYVFKFLLLLLLSRKCHQSNFILHYSEVKLAVVYVYLLLERDPLCCTL